MLERISVTDASLLVLRAAAAFVEKNGHFPTPIDLCKGSETQELIDPKKLINMRGPVLDELRKLRAAGYIDRTEGAPWGMAIITEPGFYWLASHQETEINPVATPQEIAEVEVPGQRRLRILTKSYKHKILAFLVSYQEQHQEFPKPIDILEGIGKKVTSFNRGHMAVALKELKDEGLIARRPPKPPAWKTHGFITQEGQQLVAMLPKPELRKVAGKPGPSGGVGPNGRTKFKNMLRSVYELGDDVIDLPPPDSKLGSRIRVARKNGALPQSAGEWLHGPLKKATLAHPIADLRKFATRAKWHDKNGSCTKVGRLTAA